MRFGAGVTRRAGEILVGGARMILGDVGVAGCALIVGRLSGSAREKTEKRKRGGDGVSCLCMLFSCDKAVARGLARSSSFSKF